MEIFNSLIEISQIRKIQQFFIRFMTNNWSSTNNQVGLCINQKIEILHILTTSFPSTSRISVYCLCVSIRKCVIYLIPLWFGFYYIQTIVFFPLLQFISYDHKFFEKRICEFKTKTSMEYATVWRYKVMPF